ncbi:MAG: GreA/GreB family elongation factor [Patescibacteria group bacterium]|jgi:transcription elongation factor GreA
MRIPKRRGEIESQQKRVFDNHLTPEKIARLEKDLEDLEKNLLPPAAAELRRTAEMGDLSENAAYQHAKDTLRRMNNRVLSLRARINNAIPIAAGPDAFGKITLGTTVTLKQNGRTVTYQLVGPQETKPSQGRISHHSPVGSALIGKKKGDTFSLKINDAQITFEILEVR